MDDKLLKPYQAKDTEGKIYKLWEESGLFNPDTCVEKGVTAKDAEPFSMVLPPPNVTGRLHLGHALEHSLQDALIRYERMCGKKTLWIPGTDHAAIATQSRFEKEFQKETGKSRHDFSREEFFNMIQEFALKNQKDMLGQMRLLGSSLDWSREAFTLDQKRGIAVTTAFKKMYEEGLIYRGYRVVNWDPKGQTTIADDEIVYEEREAKMYTFKYSKDFPISISTTRPETKVGDTAVAVHPSDERYQKFVGKEYDAVFCGVPIHIKVIADESVEKEFGTGALGVTPAHSMIDWEIAQKHDLPLKQVINEYAKMIVGGENLLGKKTTEAREVIVAWLASEGLLEKEEKIKQNISTAERTGGIIEPLPKLQWFVAVNKPIPSKDGKTLKQLMREPIEKGEITIMPGHFEKTYYHWIDNLRDWCISRQIIYGHRVPVWYDKENNIKLPKEQKIIFARHGESESNLIGVFAGGDVDTPLTQKGIDQAQELSQKLKNHGITKIISSNLIRAKQTAEPISKELELPIEIWNELHEVEAGSKTGTKYPENWPKDKSMLVYLIESGQGESLGALYERAEAVALKLQKIETAGNILIVGHNAFNAILEAYLTGIPKERFLEHLASTKIRVNGGFFSVTSFIPPMGENLTQDTDTLDTWFSSGLWTFSTLGWPDTTKDFTTYHPTTLMNPGYEILFPWVARMILMSEYLLGTIPFHTVYLHGIVRDSKGQKFSKSLKNGVEPEEVIEQFGMDALRMAMVVGIGPGSDINFDIQKVKAYSKFSNKIWNATRFVLEQTEGFNQSSKPELDADDAQSLAELDTFIKEITKEMDEYKFYIVAEKLYHYFWHTFADVILERSKKKIIAGENIDSAKWILVEHLRTLVTALHPFMPFITEEIWGMIQKDGRLLMVTPWPTAKEY